MILAPILLMLILGLVNFTVGLANIPSGSVVPTTSSTPVKKSDLGDELLVWDVPEYFLKNVPYYLAGYDDEGRPVWIAEGGKFPFKDLGEMASTADGWAAINKYLQQATLHIIKSIEMQNTTEREVTEAVAILDLEIWTDMTGNYALEMALNMLRPILGRAMEKIKIYGTNSDKWKNVLRRKIPEKVLPPWYGGAPALDFKPIQIYG